MSVHVIDTIKPKNNGTFPVVEAVDVKVTDSKRLDAALNDKANQSDLETLSTAVSGKASKADLNALSSTVSNKADKSALAETNTAVAGKQAALTETQIAACNSGITSELVTQIGSNATAIADKADASDVATETANLQAQIDNIVSGSTSDSEVINARVGADGTSYNTLKARLDAENNALTNDVSDINGTISDMVTCPPKNLAGQAYNTYTLSGSGTALKLAIDNDRHGYVIAVEPNTTYSIIYTLDDATYFRVASYVETASTVLDYYSHGYTTQSDGGVQTTVTTGNHVTITTGANDKCIVVTGNRSTPKLTQVLKGTYTDFVPEVYEPNKLDVYNKLYIDTAIDRLDSTDTTNTAAIAEINTDITNIVTKPIKNLAGDPYDTYTLSGSGTALKLAIDENMHGYVITVKPNTTYSIIYTLDDATYFRAASYVEGKETVLGYYSNGYTTQSDGAVQRTITNGKNMTITTGANDKCLVVTGNRSTPQLTQVVEGEYTDFVSDLYEPNKLDVYSKSQSKALVRDFKLGFVPYCYGNEEILIGYNGSKISIFYPFTLTLGKESDIPALRIPQADISVSKYDYVYINKADIPADGIINASMLHTAPYYSAIIPISSDKIVLFSVSNDVVYSTFGVEVVDTNTVAWFGDSISMLRNIPYLACQKIGAYCNDVSIAGSVMYKNIPENIQYEKFGFYEFSKAITSGDWSVQDAVASEFSGESLEHYQLLKTIDFSKINTLVALYGTNDYNASVATMQEFKTAMADSITRLLTEFPNLKMYFISPPYRTNGTTRNTQGYTLYDYVEAEKEVCESFNIPFKDLYTSSNINSLTAEYYLVDGLHVNENGEKLLSDVCAKFLASY